jgi:DNA-binding transcriptional ArsR family regulator
VALADPTRGAILERLATWETRVTEIARPFAMPLNAVSKHIRVLERARLVRDDGPGANTFSRSTANR